MYLIKENNLFKKTDWKARIEGLNEAQRLLEAFSAGQGQRDSLDKAIWNIWRMAEYAVNAGLELANDRTDRGHKLNVSAGKLKADGIPNRDYSKILDQLRAIARKLNMGAMRVRHRSISTRKTWPDCLEQVRSV